MKYTHVRRAMKAECIQWTARNTNVLSALRPRDEHTNSTVEILNFLEKNGFRGELFRDYIQIYKDNSYCNTLRRTDWIVKQENGEVKFWNDETMQSKYEPINNELDRLRAFARDMMQIKLYGFEARQREFFADKYGITVESLEAAE